MTPTSSQRARQIETWFYDNQDGEFSVLPAEHPSSIFGDRIRSRTVIYTTKAPCVIRNLPALGVESPIMVVGRDGLPMPTDLIHLTSSSIGAARYFLGDADPPDLFAFAWLREHVAIAWLGVNEEWLKRNPTSDRALLEIAMSEAERLSLCRMPELCPDCRDLIGPCCAAALDRGFKIELEGVVIGLSSRPDV